MELFHYEIFSDSSLSANLERGKHFWGRVLGIEQARIGTTHQVILEHSEETLKSLSHVEVKISGVTGEISKNVTDHLMVLARALSPILPGRRENKTGKRDNPSFKCIDRYADVNVRDVTFFIRSSKCTELTQIRFDLFDLERNVKTIKSKLSGEGRK